MFTTTVGTFILKFTFINMVIRILLTTFPTHSSHPTVVFVMAVFLALIASQGIWHVLFDPLHSITHFYFFWYFGSVEGHYICVGFSHFPLFSMDTLLTSITPCFSSSLLICSIVQSESSLLYTTPLVTFRDLWGKVLMWNLVIFSRKSAYFFFPPSWAEFHFLIFFRDISVKLLDITFSIMDGDRFVDSITMNLGKGDSASLSREESNSERFHLNLLFKKAICIICFSLVQCSTTYHGVQIVLGMYQGGNPFVLVEMGIHYQYTHVKSKILSLCQILVFVTQQSNRVKNSFPFDTSDPQPPSSSTHKIEGWAFFCRSRLDYMFGRK